MRRVLLLFVAVNLFAASFILTRAKCQQPAPGTKPPSGNVSDRGAKGDGKAGDWQALQNAVNAAAAVVQLLPGTYRIPKPIIVDLDKTGFIAIRGDGVARIVIAGEGSAFKFIGTHASTAQPSSVKDNVWDKQRMPSIDVWRSSATRNEPTASKRPAP